MFYEITVLKPEILGEMIETYAHMHTQDANSLFLTKVFVVILARKSKKSMTKKAA